MFRNRAHVGRYVAIILALIIASLLPLKYVAEETALDTEESIKSTITEFTNKVENSSTLSLADYEALAAYLESLGGYEVELSIERPSERTEEAKAGYGLTNGKLDAERNLGSHIGLFSTVDAHVHTDACYAGHNHVASNCHLLDSSCYCNSLVNIQVSATSFSERQNRGYYCDGGSSCSGCGGSGRVTSNTCRSCGGSGGSWEQWDCSSCGGTGRTGGGGCTSRAWHVCSNCNGAGCSKCGGGASGGWYVCTCCNKNSCTCSSTCSGCREPSRTCSRCGGSGKSGGSTWRQCSSCRGSGTGSSYSTTCGSCGGSGRERCYTHGYSSGWHDSYVTVSGTRYVYRCACGQTTASYERSNYSSATYRPATCTKTKCGKTHCTLANDPTPICSQVITSVTVAAPNQTIYYTEGDTFDATLNVTYLDGSSGTIAADIETPLQDTVLGTRTITLAHTGYFNTGKNYTKQTWDVTLKVIPKTRNCPFCHEDYRLNDDGSDPGCPTCHFTYKALRIFPGMVTLEPGFSDLPVEVTAVYIDLHTKALSASEWTDDCNRNQTGVRQVGISAVDENGNTRTDYITVNIEKTYTCDNCGRTYPSAADGSDPGCPYCHETIINIYPVLGKTTYTVDEELVATLKAHYYDRDEVIPADDWMAVYDFSEAGTQVVAFYYDEHVATAEVTVTNPYIRTCDNCGQQYDSRTYSICPFCQYDVVGLQVYPVSRNVLIGGTPELNVYTTLRNGSTNLIESGYNILNFSAFTLGDQLIKVTYEGKEATCIITVVDEDGNSTPGGGGGSGTGGVPSPSGTPGGGTGESGEGGSGGGGGTDPSPSGTPGGGTGEGGEGGGGSGSGGGENPTPTPTPGPTVSPLGDDYLICPNGHTYQKRPDGSDPGCPYCHFLDYADNEDVDAITGTNTRFAESTYTKEILADLYSQYDAYIASGKSSAEASKLSTIPLEQGDIVTITITRKRASFVQKVNGIFNNDYASGSYSSSCIIGPSKMS